MTNAEAIEIVEEQVLPGPAATLDAMADEEDHLVARELRDRLQAQGTAVPGDRNPIDYVIGLVRRLRGRKMIRDLGIHQTRLEWLRFHAPPDGKARLVLERTEAATAALR